MKFIVILICKLISFVGQLIGKGSSFPGAAALKLRPKILSELILPDNVIAVTGSNGKTSTTEMIASVLLNQGLNVVWNKEGSNQTEGITTLLLNNASLSGKVKGDVVLLECDERYTRHIFKYIKPAYFIVTNLYRDQLTRNAHPFYIFNIISDAVKSIPDTILILNGDDPITSQFGLNRSKVIYYGMSKNSESTISTDAIYNDCYYCPVCGNEMHYQFYHYAHLGDYSCKSCGYSHPTLSYTIESMDLTKKTMTINGDRLKLAFDSKYNAYNLCAAYAICSLICPDPNSMCKVLNNYIMKNDRVSTFSIGVNAGFLITSKHENSTSYNQSLEYIASRTAPSRLVIIVDSISRKYYTTETSWIWDISFEVLKKSAVKEIMLCGKYAYDLAVRFEASDWNDIRIVIEPDLDKAIDRLGKFSDLKIYFITCFADRNKLISRAEKTARKVDIY